MRVAAAALMLAACSAPATDETTPRDQGPRAGSGSGGAAAPPATPLPPVEPAAPGTPGGLPDDRTPVSEAPFAGTSAQGAADVVQTYFALIGERQYDAAHRLWSGGGRASGRDAAGFAADLGRYRQYDAQVGAPGRIEGAAGSRYVTVPVQVYGRTADGTPFRRSGTATLRRSDVDGATADQRAWRIERMDLAEVNVERVKGIEPSS
jgi:hypothetical protein